MKKLLVFVLVVALAASSLFAINGHGGIKMGPSFSWYNLKPQDDVSEFSSVDTTSFAIDVEGATYFNEGKNQFGVGYGMRFDMPIDTKSEAMEVDMFKFDFGFAPQVSFQYKYVMNEKLALEAGAGMSWVFYNKDMVEGAPEGVKATLKLNSFSLLANVGVSYKFTNLVGLRAGVELSTPLTYNMKIDAPNMPEEVIPKMDFNVYGIAVTPYIGVSVFY